MHVEHEHSYVERLTQIATLESELRVRESHLSDKEAELTRELASVKAHWSDLSGQLRALQGVDRIAVTHVLEGMPRVPPPVGDSPRQAALQARALAVETRANQADSRDQAVRYLREALHRAKRRLELCSVEVTTMSDLPLMETPAYPGTEHMPRGSCVRAVGLEEPPPEAPVAPELYEVETFAETPPVEEEAPAVMISLAELGAISVERVVPAEDLVVVRDGVKVIRTPVAVPIPPPSAIRDTFVSRPVGAHAEPAAEALAAEDTAERRRRARARLDVEVTLASESNFYSGFTRDLSEGGIFVATFDVKRLGERVHVEFRLPGGAQIATVGLVRWVREVATAGVVDGQWPGMGLEFVDLEPDQHAAILSFMDLREPIFYLD